MINHVEDFDCEAPNGCRYCGGHNLILRYRGKANMIGVTCEDCGRDYALPHIRRDAKRRPTTEEAHWKASVRVRDKNKCVICGSTEDLHVHHIIPVSQDPEKKYVYTVGNGVTLCSRCHAMVHPWMKGDTNETDRR